MQTHIIQRKINDMQIRLNVPSKSAMTTSKASELDTTKEADAAIEINKNLGWPRRSGSPSEVRRFRTDGSIFGRKSDPIVEAEANFFLNPIRFSRLDNTLT